MVEPRDNGAGALRSAIVRICPACGVVNPSGPSRECPHLQLARFDGLDDDLEALLHEVAAARRRYSELVALVKQRVLEAVRAQVAAVETPRPVKSADDLPSSSRGRAESLSLTHTPSPSHPEAKGAPKKRKRTGPPPVDSRQLELIALSPPKGDA